MTMFDAGKTRMIGLPYGEKTMTICSAIFIQYQRVTDGQTDRQTDGRTELLYQYRASVFDVGVKLICVKCHYTALSTWNFNTCVGTAT